MEYTVTVVTGLIIGTEREIAVSIIDRRDCGSPNEAGAGPELVAFRNIHEGDAVKVRVGSDVPVQGQRLAGLYVTVTVTVGDREGVDHRCDGIEREGPVQVPRITEDIDAAGVHPVPAIGKNGRHGTFCIVSGGIDSKRYRPVGRGSENHTDRPLVHLGHEHPGLGRFDVDVAGRFGFREPDIDDVDDLGCRSSVSCGISCCYCQRDAIFNRPGDLLAEGVVGSLPAERKEIIHDRWMGRVLQGGLSSSHPADVADRSGNVERRRDARRRGERDHRGHFIFGFEGAVDDSR